MNETSKFTINYCKIKPLKLKSLEENFQPNSEELEYKYNPFIIEKLQNYNPIYSEFFIMNETNYHRISLNSKYHFVDMKTVYDNETKKQFEKQVFIKFAPLLDPIRYMIGKYNILDERIRTLPNLTVNEDICLSKLIDKNNTSYVDSFFSFLTSKLLHNHSYIHGLDYYGSFLGIQDKYKINIADDLEYLNGSEFFLENVGKHFVLCENHQPEYMNYGSRANKNKINISSSDNHNISAISIYDIETNENLENENDDLEQVYENNKISTSSSSSSSYLSYSSSSQSNSSNSSLSSHSSISSDSNITNSQSQDDDNWETDEEDEDDDDESSNSSETSNESCINAFINNFPIQMICLEKCVGTLDDLLVNSMVDDINGASILFQIIMILITYQKLFHFTHNDLHTNNIMYIDTDIEYLYYKYNNKTYEVPTYGKIFKIIDFGRSIYKFQGKSFCSDSFSVGGDAHSQYNFEPYMNYDKPRLDPNYSFDLCRLGTSIYDFVICDDDDDEELDDFQKTIARWCNDDKHKNVLYKKNGDERYPNFKLYKMIARTVHNHTPQEQLKYDYFNQFENSSINENENIMNIDLLPCYAL